MREIKFRIWIEEFKKMIYPGSSEWPDIYLHGNGKLYELNDHHIEMRKVLGRIALEFTGLKDKNGKEIYEGDIVMGDEYILGIIKYEDNVKCMDAGRFMIRNKDGYSIEDEPDTLEESDKELEVIGNIYENPELLTPPDKESKK